MFDTLVERAFAELWSLYPSWAVYVGKHDYDGLVPDWSAAAEVALLERLGTIGDELRSLSGLEDEQDVDRELLLAAIDATVFDRVELREAELNPMQWVYLLDPDLYLRREFAPPQHRAEIVIALLGRSAATLADARSRLDRELDKTVCAWGVTAADGLAAMIDEDVVAAFAGAIDADTEAALRDAASESSARLRDFSRWLTEERLPRATHSFAIGRDAMEKLLAVNELVDMSLDDLLALGEANLVENQEALRAVAAEVDADADPRTVYADHVESVHADRGQLVEQTRGMLEDIRAFLVEHDIISIPSEVRAKVDATPRHLRWAFAMMDTPGPYERVATDAYYFVTPVEDDWDDEKAEEWLRALNTFALEDISIHEAYPGHYVHFLHYAAAPTEVSRRLTSYAFTEGWAHYTEQMMYEEGYGRGDPRFRLAQLVEALVRNCRFVCAIRMHAEGMSVDEATEFFIENALYTEMAARKEAERGTFDPGYFSYTLGKLQILALRAEYRDALGERFVLKDFHDRLLSRGAPPVEVMRRRLLAEVGR